MVLVNKLLKIAGKEGVSLDKRIGTKYILGLCYRYALMGIRGFLFAINYRTIDNSIFVGRKVKVLEKRSLTVGSKTKLHDYVYIDALSSNGVKLGSNVVLGRNTRIECTGSITCIGKGIVVGNRTTFGSDCFFGAAGGIEIGDDVVAGQAVRFHSENHNFSNLDLLIREQGVSHKGIKIGNDCWIGSGAVFLDGAAIGDGCVVGANAVVTRKFGNNCVIAGIPAKIISCRGKERENGIFNT